jgi:hypothetical protein
VVIGMEGGLRVENTIGRIERGMRELREIAKLDRATLARSYGVGKWNGIEILAHLADADLVYYYRFLKVIAEEGVPIVPFDENRWVVELRAGERPVEVSIAGSAGARAGLVHYLKTMPESVLQRSTVHPENGVMTALDLAERAGNHALHHLEQLAAIRDGRTWSAKTA